MNAGDVVSQRRMSCYRALALIALVAAIAFPVAVWAQSQGGAFTIRKQVISGGIVSNGGQYRLVGTVSQTTAAVQSGGTFKLTGGFHTPGASPGLVFCDSFENTLCP